MPAAASVLIGPCRHAVDANSSGPRHDAEVADVRLETRFREAHHVVVGQRAQRAEIRERHHRSLRPFISGRAPLASAARL
jgi:hypothetical protein